MDFGLGFQTCHFREGTYKIIDPFTEEELVLPNEGSFTDYEYSAVKELFHLLQTDGPNVLGDYAFRLKNVEVLSDFGTIELFHRESPSFRVDVIYQEEPLIDEVVHFLFELAQRGNACICSSIDPGHVAVTSPQSSAAFLQRWPNAVVAFTPAELRQWLKKSLAEGKVV